MNGKLAQVTHLLILVSKEMLALSKEFDPYLLFHHSSFSTQLLVTFAQSFNLINFMP